LVRNRWNRCSYVDVHHRRRSSPPVNSSEHRRIVAQKTLKPRLNHRLNSLSRNLRINRLNLHSERHDETSKQKSPKKKLNN
jgi:hypothetical protein